MPLRPVVKMSLAVAAFAGVAVLASSAFADEPQPVVRHDPGIYPPAGTGSNLFLTGAAISVGWYGVGLGTSYLWTKSPGSHELRIPVAGPFMALADTGCGPREKPCSKPFLVLRTILTGLSAVGQVGGIAAMVEALFVPTAAPGTDGARPAPPTLTRPGTADRGVRSPATATSITPIPMVFGSDSVGLGVVAHF